MNWIRFDLATLRSPEYLGSEPVERATWINLMAYCADQENGGHVADCRAWKDRKWMQLAGVTLAEVQADCDLWEWKGSALLLWGYPEEDERDVLAKREAGREAVKKRKWRPPKETFDESKGDLCEGKADLSQNQTDQTRPDQSTPDKIRPDQTAPPPNGVGDFLNGQGVGSGCQLVELLEFCSKQAPGPEKLIIAHQKAREFHAEMERDGWKIQGQKVEKPIGLFHNRMTRAGILPKKRIR